jgi:hypothetical protein
MRYRPSPACGRWQGAVVYQSLLAHGHFPAGLPGKLNIFSGPVTRFKRTAAADFPNYSYGIAEDFHPTSFEVYFISIALFFKDVKTGAFQNIENMVNWINHTF